MKLLLYGGTFDPPHYGHLNNLRAAAARVAPDRVVVMPAGASPFKHTSPTPPALRAEMCGCFAALAEATGADCVQVIGSKFVLYLQKNKDSAYADLLK